MPKLFEVFGYPLEDTSSEAQHYRAEALCPFMDAPCDGGGNRHLSNIQLRRLPELASLYPGRDTIPSGVCSIQLREDEAPWIVCPRRLLALGRGGPRSSARQKHVKKFLFDRLPYERGVRVGVWPEVKLKFEDYVNGQKKVFDYTFDYILMPVKRGMQSEIESLTGQSWQQAKASLAHAGYTLGLYGTERYVEEFPVGVPTVVEIMTSSTSGGNRQKRTTIPLAFEDAILHRMHLAPGINYRQVWARMVSQLIVKSEVALNWGGRALWVLQDVLLNYINTTTGLNILSYLNDQVSEVNILSITYGDLFRQTRGPLELRPHGLYSGPITTGATGGFQEMVRAPVLPTLHKLRALLLRTRAPIALIDL